MALRRSVEHIGVSQVPQSLPVVLVTSESAKSSSPRLKGSDPDFAVSRHVTALALPVLPIFRVRLTLAGVLTVELYCFFIMASLHRVELSLVV